MLTTEYLRSVVKTMREKGIRVAKGLTETEILSAEGALGVKFPPDLRTFLKHALPKSKGFPNWRKPSSAQIAERLAWPADSMCFDIEHSDFWLPEWGKRPNPLEKAKARARK